MSTHAIEVVEIGEVSPHPNADQLETTTVWGWQCCVRKGEYKAGDRAVYIPPDFLVPTSRAEFAFLKRDGREQERIRVKRLRGQLSQGLLIPWKGDDPIGANVMESLGVERYEPPLKMSMSADLFIGGPSGLYTPKFDVESYQRYRECFTPGEEVVITEKIHGANARYTYASDKDGAEQLFCGSRTNWVRPDKASPWTLALKAQPGIELWCRQNPGCVLYGEAFGQVQSLKYGASNSQIFFAAFAAMDRQLWMEWDRLVETCDRAGVTKVPLLYRGPFDESEAYAMAELDSSWPGAIHEREGVVILPTPERVDPNLGRVCLKMVSNRYLEKG